MFSYFERDDYCEESPDWDAICPHCHGENREAIREIIDMINEGDMDYDWLIEKMNKLAYNYGIDGVKDEPTV